MKALVEYIDMRGARFARITLLVTLTYLLVMLGIGMYWSYPPAEPVMAAGAAKRAEVVGSRTTQTLQAVAGTLLAKRGGYISNDIFPPGVWLDNISNWEFGALVQVRDLARALRRDISRSQSQSAEDRDLAIAEPQFHFDNNSWAMPASESEYERGIKALGKYLDRLSAPAQQNAQPNAQFYARADNLNAWLGDIETRLGSLSQRLGASVGTPRLHTGQAGDPATRPPTRRKQEMEVRTSWWELDDVFYEARGTAWALIQFLQAVEHDFGEVLDKKNARVSLQQIIRELEGTQETLWAPMVLNGSGFGLLANHSLVMASYLARANAGIIQLRELLSQG